MSCSPVIMNGNSYLSDSIRGVFSEQSYKLLLISFSYVTFFGTLYGIAFKKINLFVGLGYWVFFHFVIFKPQYCVPPGYFCLVKTRYRKHYTVVQGAIYVIPFFKELFKDENGLVATFPLEHDKIHPYSCSNDAYEIVIEASFRIQNAKDFLDHCTSPNKNPADMLRYGEFDKNMKKWLKGLLQKITSDDKIEQVQKRADEIKNNGSKQLLNTGILLCDVKVKELKIQFTASK